MLKNLLKTLMIFFFSLNSLWGFTSEAPLKEARELIDHRQYKSAWETLHRHAEEIPYSEMMILKAELSIRYYSRTNMFQTFSFSNIKEGETLTEIRKNGNVGDMKLFDPAGALLSALQKDPENGRIHYWLGEFYFTVLHLIGEESGMSREELEHQIILHYRKALEKGKGDEISAANLGYTELTVQDWSSAAVHFREALSYNAENPAYHYNLATALVNSGNTSEAEESLKKALEGFTSEGDRADALFLGSTLALMEDNGEKAKDYLIQGKSASPRDYRFPERLIQISLVQENWDDAVQNSRDFFDLYPRSPETCQIILNHFHAFQSLEKLDPFFSGQVEKYKDDPESLGNLLYHWGVASLISGHSATGKEHLISARKEFDKVFPESHQIFGIIDNLLSQESASSGETDQTD